MMSLNDLADISFLFHNRFSFFFWIRECMVLLYFIIIHIINWWIKFTTCDWNNLSSDNFRSNFSNSSSVLIGKQSMSSNESSKCKCSAILRSPIWLFAHSFFITVVSSPTISFFSCNNCSFVTKWSKFEITFE